MTKNTLTKLAAKDAGLEGLFDDILNGQVGIAYANDPTAPAKVIKEFKKENNDLLEILGLFFDGKLYSSDKYKEFANMPSKEESLAKLIALLQSPLTKLVWTLKAPLSNVGNALNNIKQNKSN